MIMNGSTVSDNDIRRKENTGVMRAKPDPAGLSRRWRGDAGNPEEVLSFGASELLESLSRKRLDRMFRAGEQLIEADRALARAGANIVGLLAGDDAFREWDHYPAGDCHDPETHCQYYYHAHRGAPGEHGHFHTFLRSRGMPEGARPLPLERTAAWPRGSESVAHLIAVSMNETGVPTHLFTTNRWVTGEALYGAGDVLAMLDRFVIDQTDPSWMVNRWMTALLGLFRPQIEQLLHKRDAVIARRLQLAEQDPLEDRDLEITSIARIDTNAQIEAIRRALAR